MIELLQGFPDHVLAVKADGRVAREDYQAVLIPAAEDALRRHEKIRLYYQIGSDFAGIDPGAVWEDLKIGVEHLTRWERVAVVTEVDWMRHLVGALGFLMPGELRVFTLNEDAKARTWVASG